MLKSIRCILIPYFAQSGLATHTYMPLHATCRPSSFKNVPVNESICKLADSTIFFFPKKFKIRFQIIEAYYTRLSFLFIQKRQIRLYSLIQKEKEKTRGAPFSMFAYITTSIISLFLHFSLFPP